MWKDDLIGLGGVRVENAEKEARRVSQVVSLEMVKGTRV
jgi:hypothetical protein